MKTLLNPGAVVMYNELPHVFLGTSISGLSRLARPEDGFIDLVKIQGPKPDKLERKMVRGKAISFPTVKHRGTSYVKTKNYGVISCAKTGSSRIVSETIINLFE